MSITITQEQLQTLITSTESTLELLNSIFNGTPTTLDQPYFVCKMFDLENRPYDLYLAPKSSEVDCTWDEAMSYADKAEICGHTDWVVPNRSELLRLYELLGPEHTTITEFKEGGSEVFVAHGYWSSAESTATYSWYQSFSNGNQPTTNKAHDSYLRLVRRVAT
jgi:hypothetical protein